MRLVLQEFQALMTLVHSQKVAVGPRTVYILQVDLSSISVFVAVEEEAG